MKPADYELRDLKADNSVLTRELTQVGGLRVGRRARAAKAKRNKKNRIAAASRARNR